MNIALFIHVMQQVCCLAASGIVFYICIYMAETTENNLAPLVL